MSNLELLELMPVQILAIKQHINKNSFEIFEFDNSEIENNPLRQRKRLLEECVCVCVFRHLGFFEISLEFVKRSIEFGNRVAYEYYYGQHIHEEPWRSEIDKNKSDGSVSWLVVFREGLLLSILGDNKKTQISLANWLEKDVPFDESSYLLTEADNAYYKLLASFLRGDAFDSDLIKQIQSTRKKRPRLLLDCIAALDTRDEKQLQSALKKYLSYYIKSELSKSGFPTMFCIDASIIYNLAMKSNLNIDSLNEKQHSIIMTRNSLGI